MKKRTVKLFLTTIVIVVFFCLITVEKISYPCYNKEKSNLITNNLLISYTINWKANGTEICTADNQQKSLQLIGDGYGEAIIVWQDRRSGTNWDIYAQRINATGDVQWNEDGVPICTAIYNQTIPQIVSDGDGGAIIVWLDRRSGTNWDIYAQRINATGDAQWTENGIPICTDDNPQEYFQLGIYGVGGAIIIWEDSRNGNKDIYAQKINATGDAQWTENGVPICTDGDAQWNPKLINDGVGGAIITWQDWRSTYWDIYAQKINATGDAQWTEDGVPVCTAGYMQQDPNLISDGAGGAIIVWQDYRDWDWDIYSQRINSAGVGQWTTNGVPVCTAVWSQAYFQLISDGDGGAIITWQDARWQDGDWDIFAQRINSAGVGQWTTVQWTTDGVPICTASDNQTRPQLTNDGAGGAIITWQDERMGNCDIAAQKIDAAGILQWTYYGIPICTAVLDQESPQLVSDGIEGAIIAWQDNRNGNLDIYASRIIDVRTPAPTARISGDSDDDGDSGDKEGEAIPGYNIMWTIAILSIIFTVLLKKQKIQKK